MKECIRPDISDQLVHFTRTDGDEGAFQNLKKIIIDRTLIISPDKRNRIPVVSFTETPLSCIERNKGFKSLTGWTFTSSFGLIFTKEYLHKNHGCRPIMPIDNVQEYDLLDNSMKWKAQIYNPKFVPPYENSCQEDWAWQREWRSKDSVEFHFGTFEVIVPNQHWYDRLVQELLEHGTIENEACLANCKYPIEEDSDCNPCDCPPIDRHLPKGFKILDTGHQISQVKRKYLMSLGFEQNNLSPFIEAKGIS